MINTLLSNLAARGIRLDADGDRLRVDAPPGVLSPALIEELRTHKIELLALLRCVALKLERPDARIVWQAALDRLEGDPDFPADAMEGLRAAGVRWEDDNPDADHADGDVEVINPPETEVSTNDDAIQCDHCGNTEYVDVPIHDGRSSRRDCTWCRRLIAFPRWYERVEVSPSATASRRNKPPATSTSLRECGPPPACWHAGSPS